MQIIRATLAMLTIVSLLMLSVVVKQAGEIESLNKRIQVTTKLLQDSTGLEPAVDSEGNITWRTDND